jgi:outer membrane protein/protease secretion system outer membrane protein
LRCLIGVAFASCAGQALAIDLLQAYQAAIGGGDATFLAALSSAEASREAVPQARAGLLPSLGISGSKSKNTLEQQRSSFIGGTSGTNYDYPSVGYSLNLRQPLFRLSSLAQYYQAKAQVTASEANLDKETQDLAIRVAGAYFDALLALERLDLVIAQKGFYAAQQAMAERAVLAGTGTRTDVDDTKARYDMSVAQEIEARNQVSVTERSLKAIVNQPVVVTTLRRIDPQRLKLDLPEPESLDAWISRAEDENYELRGWRANLEAARQEVNKNRAAHLPTVDLVASKSYSDSENINTFGYVNRQGTVGIQLNIPLYSGGGVNSAVRQAVATQERVRQQLEAARRQVEVNVSKEFSSVAQGVPKVRALEQAILSAEQSLTSTRKGVLAGTRTSVDVLNAQQQLASTRLDLARSRMEYVLARLRLKAVAGSLQESDIEQANGWLAP